VESEQDQAGIVGDVHVPVLTEGDAVGVILQDFPGIADRLHPCFLEVGQLDAVDIALITTIEDVEMEARHDSSNQPRREPDALSRGHAQYSCRDSRLSIRSRRVQPLCKFHLAQPERRIDAMPQWA
jgi:hypothetical protein